MDDDIPTVTTFMSLTEFTALGFGADGVMVGQIGPTYRYHSEPTYLGDDDTPEQEPPKPVPPVPDPGRDGRDTEVAFGEDEAS